MFTIPNLAELKVLLFPASTIAILAAIESLLSATVADNISRTKHNPDAELNALGVGNILSAFACGIPATGAIARTATNIHSGGKTPTSSTLHAVFIMIYILLFAKIINFIPMACLSALLINTAYRMSHYKQFYRVLQIAPKSDSFVLLTCFLLTIFVDMIAGVGIGMIYAAFLLIKRVTEMTQVEFEVKDNLPSDYSLPEGTLLHRIRGPLFFGTIEKAFDRQKPSYDRIDTFIVDITNVPFIDMTGLVAMKSMLTSIAHEQCQVHIVCNTPMIENKLRKKIQYESCSPFVYFHKTLNEALAAKKQILSHWIKSIRMGKQPIMYSYQHKYHAGNFADIHKHLSLLVCLSHFHKKDTPYCVLDAFAGEGIYDLTIPEALKNKEYHEGFHKILQLQKPIPIVQKLLNIALKLDKNGTLYPGSSYIIKDSLRSQDRAILLENHPQAFQALKKNLIFPNVEIHKRDAYEGLKALIPFKEKRGLIFLDPSYEVKEEYAKLAQAVLEAYKKFPTAVFMIWYPLLKEQHYHRLVQPLASLQHIWHFEVKPSTNIKEGKGMLGSGLFFINPPWKIDNILNELFHDLHQSVFPNMLIKSKSS